MGKKTNWTVTEDQTLCRAWLNASETVLPQSSDQKASTFWNVVYHLFHAELDTAVERPHNGLKIRWTRINRDVQKFALIFAQVQTLAAEIKASSRAATAAAGGTLSDAADGLESEQQCIDDAKEQFYKEHDTKFLFEACWKLLRYSPKWIQLLANSAGVSAPHSASSMASAAAAAAAHHFLTVDAMPRVDESPGHATTQAAEPTGGNSNTMNKRRASALLETYGRGPIQQLQDVTSTLVDEMRRRNELLEEQNAISLFRLETEIIEDDDAREYFELLRRRYVKKIRAAIQPPASMVSAASANSSNNAHTLNDALAESAAAAAAVAAGETLSEDDEEERKHGDKQLVHGDIV